MTHYPYMKGDHKCRVFVLVILNQLQWQHTLHMCDLRVAFITFSIYHPGMGMLNYCKHVSVLKLGVDIIFIKITFRNSESWKQKKLCERFFFISQVIPCLICCVQSGNETGFLWVLIFSLAIVIPPAFLILFTDHMPNNLSNWQHY